MSNSEDRFWTQEIRDRFATYKSMTERAWDQVSEAQYFAEPEAGNSLAVIVRHMVGNLRSRFTDFWTSDGEKLWRHRDREFEAPEQDMAALRADWDDAWQILFDILDQSKDSDLHREVLIRNEPHSAAGAMLRQLAHYAYHIGQFVDRARALVGEANWQSLSIPRGQSEAFNKSHGL